MAGLNARCVIGIAAGVFTIALGAAGAAQAAWLLFGEAGAGWGFYHLVWLTASLVALVVGGGLLARQSWARPLALIVWSAWMAIGCYRLYFMWTLIARTGSAPSAWSDAAARLLVIHVLLPVTFLIVYRRPRVAHDLTAK